MSRPAGGPAGPHPEARLSRAAAGRLSLYLRRLEEFRKRGAVKVSSGQLAGALGLSDAQVRRDLACLGGLGHPGVGYVTGELIATIRQRLGLDRDWSVALVGVGNLARALLRYQGFRQQGFQVRALFDNNPAVIGQVVEGIPVRPLAELRPAVAAVRAELGVITVPSEAAQAVADELAGAGIRGILNFAPVVLRLPERVSLVTVDLTVQLEQLAFLVQVGSD
jgi:redox-sensing transcriptional repressor